MADQSHHSASATKSTAATVAESPAITEPVAKQWRHRLSVHGQSCIAKPKMLAALLPTLREASK